MATRCEFQKRNGERCGADTQTGNILCVFHDPERAADGRRARSAGGITRSRTAAVLPADTPDHPLSNTKEVAIFLANSINQLRRGQIDPRVATGMGYLTTVLLRALEQGPLEDRMAKIETALAQAASSKESIRNGTASVT